MMRSTSLPVPTGTVDTADKVKAEIAKALADRSANLEFDVVSNPEFLKEGAAKVRPIAEGVLGRVKDQMGLGL